jgi:hypothetical protein
MKNHFLSGKLKTINVFKAKSAFLPLVMAKKCGIIFTAHPNNVEFASLVPDIKLFFRFVKEIIYPFRKYVFL